MGAHSDVGISLSNIRLVWRGLTTANDLAYYDTVKITTVKGLSTVSDGSTVVELSTRNLKSLNPPPERENGYKLILKYNKLARLSLPEIFSLV